MSPISCNSLLAVIVTVTLLVVIFPSSLLVVTFNILGALRSILFTVIKAFPTLPNKSRKITSSLVTLSVNVLRNTLASVPGTITQPFGGVKIGLEVVISTTTSPLVGVLGLYFILSFNTSGIVLSILTTLYPT